MQMVSVTMNNTPGARNGAESICLEQPPRAAASSYLYQILHQRHRREDHLVATALTADSYSLALRWTNTPISATGANHFSLGQRPRIVEPPRVCGALKARFTDIHADLTRHVWCLSTIAVNPDLINEKHGMELPL